MYGMLNFSHPKMCFTYFCVYPLLKNSIQYSQYPDFIEWVIKPPMCPLRSTSWLCWKFQSWSQTGWLKHQYCQLAMKIILPNCVTLDKSTGPTFNTTHTAIGAAKILKSTWTNKMGWRNDMNIRLVLKLSQQRSPNFLIFLIFSPPTHPTRFGSFSRLTKEKCKGHLDQNQQYCHPYQRVYWTSKIM